MTGPQLRFRASVLLVGSAFMQMIALPQQERNDPGIVRMRYVSIVVRDYDEALRWYTNVLGMEKMEDGIFCAKPESGAALSTDCPPGKATRWLVVAPRGRKDVGIILELARSFSANDSIHNYKARIGKETRWVFEVEDCRRFYELASKRGVKFVENPVEQQAWGVTEAMFEDLYGNVFVVESFRKK